MWKQDSQWLKPTGVRTNDGREVKRIDEQSFAISTYEGAPATTEEVRTEITRLKNAFPQMSAPVFATIIEMLVEEGWTRERIQDAVKKVIMTNKYPTFTPATLLEFDKPKKLYNYRGYCNLISQQKAVHEDFDSIKIDGKIFWYLKNEL